MNKVTFLFCSLFFCFFQAKADESKLPKFSIRFENQSLDSALSQLVKESRCWIYYQDTIDSKSAMINQTFEDSNISQILETLLANTDYNHVVYGNGKNVIIYKKKYNFSTVRDKPISITGKIVNEKDENVVGASICKICKETMVTNLSEDNCTCTDIEGHFVISTSNPYFLVVYIGYLPRVVHISDAKMIKLEPNFELLDLPLKDWDKGMIFRYPINN